MSSFQTLARQGPRPVSLHMAMAMWTWTGSVAALPLAQKALMPWMPKLGAEAARLTAALETADPTALASAVQEEAGDRATAFLGAIEAYRAHPYTRDVVDPAPIMEVGAAALRDYGGNGPAALFVPSLVNRAYILDLCDDAVCCVG